MPCHEKSRRLLEAAAVILAESAGQTLNIVSLNKAIFYLDLVSLRDIGETFTQNVFVALSKGPVVAKYNKRLVKALADEGIATQSNAGLARPVTLQKLPTFLELTERVNGSAREIAQWISGKTSAEASDFSHDNIGWALAYREGLQGCGMAAPINMHLAMQQIVEDDPWLSVPFTRDSDTAFHAADLDQGNVW